MSTRLTSAGLLLVEMLLLLLALLFLAPFYFVLVNSVKTTPDILRSAADWPAAFAWGNYSKAWGVLVFPKALWNTLQITVLSNLTITIFSAMAAYRVVRRKSKFNSAVFYVFLASMSLPFQAIMIPLVKLLGNIGLVDKIAGVVLVYTGLGLAFSIFLYRGFVKTIPYEIEESAIMDGCHEFRLFWEIVFPLLSPITLSILILNTLWLWNDFMVPLILLHNPELNTIQLAINSLFGEYMKQWDLALAALVMAVLPIVVYFLALQKHVMEGITGGAIKG